MLTYNQNLHITFNDSLILLARNGEVGGLGNIRKAETEEEIKEVNKYKDLKMYCEIREKNKRNPYKEYIRQFPCFL